MTQIVLKIVVTPNAGVGGPVSIRNAPDNYILQAGEFVDNTLTEADRSGKVLSEDLVSLRDPLAGEDWEAKRTEDRGSWQTQLEYLLDNGYDAFKARDDAIKVTHPKP